MVGEGAIKKEPRKSVWRLWKKNEPLSSLHTIYKTSLEMNPKSIYEMQNNCLNENVGDNLHILKAGKDFLNWT